MPNPQDVGRRQEHEGTTPLFGAARNEQILREAFLYGQVTVNARGSRRLVRSGLVRLHESPFAVSLHTGHPAYHELRALLADLTGMSGVPACPLAEAPEIDTRMPLAQCGHYDFRVLALLLQSEDGLDATTLASAIPDAWPSGLRETLERLVGDSLLIKNSNRYLLDPGLPQTYLDLIARLAEHLKIVLPPNVRCRPAAFMSASDGAPRLFGTDTRLRHLIALAENGPMYELDLRRSIGDNAKEVGRDFARFGRGDVTLHWGEGKERAVMLDPEYPLALHLRRLLKKLAQTYSVPPPIKRYGTPVPPDEIESWIGDRLALFGGHVPTSVLLPIGVLGWTFEALCVKMATGYDRVVVKKAVKRMEQEGLLQGDRPRRPGMDVRVLSISEKFPAKVELEALLRAYVRAWPQVERQVESRLASFAPKTKAHLRKRGLI